MSDAVGASVVLYGKADCHLCDDAAAMLERLAGQLRLRWRKIDIEADPALFERYRYRIPVIEILNGPVLDWPTTPERVRRAVLSVTAS